MTRSLAHRTLAVLAALAVAIGAIFAVLMVNVDNENASSRRAREAESRVAAAVGEQKLLLDLETGLRGYLITGQPRFLEPYSSARGTLPAQTQQLAALSADDPEAAESVQSIRDAIGSYQDDYATAVATRPVPTAPRARAALASEGKTRMDGLRAQLDGFIAREIAQSRDIGADAAGSSHSTIRLAAIGLATSVLLVLLVALYAMRSVLAPVRRVAAAARRLAAGDLAARVNERGAGELAELAESFNEMATSMQQMRDELERQNAELEAQQGELEMVVEDLGDEKTRVDRYQRFSTRLAAKNDLRPLAETILEEIGDIAEAQVGAFYVLPTGTEDALLMASRGISPTWLPAELNTGHGLAGRALGERRSMTASYGESGLRLPAFGSSVALSHELHVPLLQGDRTVGVVTLGRMEDIAFSPKEIQTIEYLAERAAVGISNAVALLVARDQAAINRAVLETAADGFFSVDGNGVITQWNSQAERMFGFERAEAVGSRVTDLIVPEESREPYLAELRRFVSEGDWVAHGARELTALHSDGYEFPVEATITPLQLGDTWQFNAFIRDISHRKRVERYEAAHNSVIRALAEGSDIDDARLRTLEALGTGLGFEYAATWGVDEDLDRLTCTKTWTAEGYAAPTMEETAGGTTLACGESIAGRVWETCAPMWAADLATDPNFTRTPLAAADGVRSSVAIPIANGNDFIGVLQLFSTEVRAGDAELMGRLAAIGSQIGEYVARKRAEAEADRLKDEFFALVSHELRTPLTSILGYLELVLEEPGGVDEETARFLAIVRRNGRRLMRLVDDLLFVAQVEAGKISLDPGIVDMTAVVAESVEAAKPRAAEKSIVLKLDADRVPAAMGDAGRLGQAMDNLISNALKFTDEGGSVEVKLVRDGDSAVISVSDTGMGIPADDQSRLFDRFFRSERAAEQAVPGVGLGLTIVKAIVEGHGGAISLESEEGAGTTFGVRLPLRPFERGLPSLGSKADVAR